MKLLYAEDEVTMSDAVVDILTYHKYQVDAVYDGKEALEFAESEKYDGIILDIMMPKLTGLEVLRKLRSMGDKTPILLLSAKSEIEDKIEGLELGADDYLPKPFDSGELIARVRAMLRRRENFTPDILTLGNVSLNLNTYELSSGDNSFVLSKLEYLLMELLMLNSEMYMPSERILEKVWGYQTDTDIGTVWVYVSYLRKKLQILDSNVKLVAKRNVGYKLEVKNE